MLAVPRAKPVGWTDDDDFTPVQATQMDVNIELLDQEADRIVQLGGVSWQASRLLAPSPAFGAIPQLVPLLPARAFDLGGDRFRIPILMGDAAGGGTQRLFTANGLVYNTGGLISPSFTGFVEASAGGPGELFVIKVAASDSHQYSTDHGATWTLGTVGTAGLLRHAGYAYVNSQHCYLLGDSLGAVQWKHTLAGTLTTYTMPGASSASAVHGEFANNGTTTIVYCVPVDGHSYSSIFYSTDSGHSWSLGTQLDGLGNVKWSKYWQRFIAWDDTGDITTSADGITWTFLRNSLVSLAGIGVFAGKRTFAVAGPFIAKLWRNTTFNQQQGVAISANLGADGSWNFFPLSERTDYIMKIYGFNGRFYANSDDTVWQSTPFAAQAREL